MHNLSQLVIAIAPLVLFAAISPVVFLNANTAVSNHGQRGGWQFVAGNAAVLVVLGSACVGMLGAAANDFAQREIASKTVDRFLGVGLLGYAVYLAWTHHQKHGGTSSGGDEAASSAEPPAVNGMVGWGLIGMMTNFTTLPLFASVAQRIGAAQIGWVARIITLAVVVCCVVTPAWLPVVLARVWPSRASVSASTRQRISRWTSLASIGACVVGGVILLITSR